MENLKMSTERLFLRSPNIHVAFRTVVSGSVTPESLGRAMDKVFLKHPLLNCSIHADENHEAWFVPSKSKAQIDWLPKGSDWKSWHKASDNIPFDFANGPLARMCAIDQGDKTEIVTLTHHVIGDGIGCLNLAKDILLALDERLDPSPQVPPVNNKFREGQNLGLLSKLAANKLNSQWSKCRRSFSEDEYRSFFESYRKAHVPEINIFSIDEPDLSKLVAVSKANGLTVNELMTAAFASAMSELKRFKQKSLKIGIAASTRNELISDPKECMGNYVTGIAFDFACDPKTGFQETCKNLAKVARIKLQDLKTKHLIVNFLSAFDTDLVESIMFATYGGYDLPVSRKIGELIQEGDSGSRLGMSNLGRHQLSFKSFDLLDMQFIGPAFPANLLSVSVITVNSKLSACLSWNGSEISKDEIEKIQARAIELMLG
ncbi:MAG: condensation domain-containing protein [Clostridiales bacterium]|jgi:NRPS condensation-like uncharacterized protein|nr:condensation domain-containing protein [Clostridiales bacterium]